MANIAGNSFGAIGGDDGGPHFGQQDVPGWGFSLPRRGEIVNAGGEPPI
ncbi:MAG: hypothetical protein SH868_10120 [Bythopirellula sp.]|nr:hypothetical protein [Bythopirellula sp.]